MLRVHTTLPLVWWKLKRLMKAHLVIREPPPPMEENVASKDSSKNKNLRLVGLHDWRPN